MPDELSMDEQFLARTQQLIDKNHGREDFSVEELASLTGLSRSMLHRKLIAITGSSASELITRKRLTKARELLEAGSATVSEVAYKVGFSSPNYFNKVFRKYYKSSPGDILKGKRIKSDPFSKSANKHGRRKKTGWQKPLIFALIFLALVLLLTWTFNYRSINRVHEQSIAVLPFALLSEDKADYPLACAVVDDLLSKLSRIDDLKVISRTSSELYPPGSQVSIPRIAKELGVAYILEGSIFRNENRLRINVQLIDAQKDDHIWARSYDREVGDLFRIQSEIALKIVSELDLVLTQQQIQHIKRNGTNNRLAFELCQLGRIHTGERNLSGYQKSIRYYNQAIELDKEYALPYCGIADNYVLMAINLGLAPDTLVPKAKQLAGTAMELEPEQTQAYVVLGTIASWFEHDYASSEQAYQTALALDPNNATAYHYLAVTSLIQGQESEAFSNLARAQDLDPLSFALKYMSAHFNSLTGHYQEALAANKTCLGIAPEHYWPMQKQVEIFYRMNNKTDAFQSMRSFIRYHGSISLQEAEDAYNSGGLDSLIKLEARAGPIPEYKVRWYCLIEEYDLALDLIIQKMEKGQMLPLLEMQWLLRAAKDDPRYQKAMSAARLNLQ